MKALLRHIAPLLLLLPLAGVAQSRTELWSRITLTHAAGKHWQLWADVQYRRQANYLIDSHNLLDRPLAYTGRVFVGYKLPHKTMIFISPAAIFESIKLQNNGDTLAYETEYRTTIGAWHNHSFGKFDSRIRLSNESRFFLTTDTRQQRQRLLLQTNRPLHTFGEKSALNLVLSDEVFTHLNPGGDFGFDHNRAIAALQFTRNKHDLTTGYQWHHQPIAGKPSLNRNVFFVNLSLNI